MSLFKRSLRIFSDTIVAGCFTVFDITEWILSDVVHSKSLLGSQSSATVFDIRVRSHLLRRIVYSLPRVGV